jgi:hypothetical protein
MKEFGFNGRNMVKHGEVLNPSTSVTLVSLLMPRYNVGTAHTAKGSSFWTIWLRKNTSDIGILTVL